MSRQDQYNRRDFIKVAISATGGLILSFDPSQIFAGHAVANHQLGIFVELATDNTVRIIVPVPEIDQGVRTALPMVLADEMNVAWETVRVVQAQASEKYGSMSVGGSYSIAGYYDAMRNAGALARELLISAAEKRLNVPRETLFTKDSQVINRMNNQTLTYGELAAEAASMPRPDEIPLKNPKDFQLIGRSIRGVDVADIITGRAEYGYDIAVPNMLYAMIERCPVQGGTIKTFDATQALKIPGVKKVFELKPILINNQKYGAVRGGVVVVADSFWSAQKGRESLKTEWNEGKNSQFGTSQLKQSFQKLKAQPGRKVIRKTGDPNPATAIAKQIEAECAIEAAAVSKAVGQPVKVVWTRPDTTHHDYFRPPSFHKMRAALNEKNELTSWYHHLITSPLLKHITAAEVQFPETYDAQEPPIFPTMFRTF